MRTPKRGSRHGWYHRQRVRYSLICPLLPLRGALWPLAKPCVIVGSRSLPRPRIMSTHDLPGQALALSQRSNSPSSSSSATFSNHTRLYGFDSLQVTNSDSTGSRSAASRSIHCFGFAGTARIVASSCLYGRMPRLATSSASSRRAADSVSPSRLSTARTVDRRAAAAARGVLPLRCSRPCWRGVDVPQRTASEGENDRCHRGREDIRLAVQQGRCREQQAVREVPPPRSRLLQDAQPETRGEAG